MFLHFLFLFSSFHPRNHFNGTNNDTNCTEINFTRNGSYPFYNMDQDYSNMTSLFRLPPFIFKRDLEAFPHSVATVKNSELIEKVKPTVDATTHQEMTEMAQKIADDIAKNLFSDITVPMNQTGMVVNGTGHVNSSLPVPDSTATVKNSELVEKVKRTVHATTHKEITEMAQKITDDVDKNVFLDITVPKNQTRMVVNGTGHVNSSLPIPDSAATVKNSELIKKVKPTVHATTHQEKTEVAQKITDDVAKNHFLDITVPKNQTWLVVNDIGHVNTSLPTPVA